MATLTNFPCKGCVAPKRHPGCHATCSDYIEAKAENDRLNDIHKKEQQERNAQYSDVVRLLRYSERRRK